jgi:hypothetical protein
MAMRIISGTRMSMGEISRNSEGYIRLCANKRVDRVSGFSQQNTYRATVISTFRIWHLAICLKMNRTLAHYPIVKVAFSDSIRSDLI